METAATRLSRSVLRVLSHVEASDHREEHHVIDLVICPEPFCAAPAEIIRRWTWPSTAGPVEHAATLCLGGHAFTCPVEPVPSPSAPVGTRF
jgi:hypothetical protein